MGHGELWSYAYRDSESPIAPIDNYLIPESGENAADPKSPNKPNPDEYFVIGSYTDIEEISNHLFSEKDDKSNSVYNPSIIPVEGNQRLTVRTKIYLDEIIRFDTYNQELDLLMKVTFEWHDVRLNWDPSKYGGVTEIDVDPSKVWFPNIGLKSPSTGYARFTSEGNTNNIQIKDRSPGKKF